MRIALLGLDDETLALLRWGVEQEDTSVVVGHEIPSQLEPQLRRLAPGARVNELNWEGLLLEGSVDLVVVSRGRADGSQSDGMTADELRAEQLRKLLAAEVPLLMVHPACDLLLAYEVDMARRDTGRQVLVHHRGMEHPAFESLQSMRAENDLIGAVEHVTVERGLTSRDRASVLQAFSQDVPLLRSLLGGINKVTASGPITEAMVDPLGPKRKDLPSLANLLINLQGAASFPARWSVGPASGQEKTQLTLVGSAGRATLTMIDSQAAAEASWRFEIAAASSEQYEVGRDEEWRKVWARAREMISSREAPADWAEVCHDLEVVSVIDRSVQKGRTIELFGEERSEAESFKGVMAVGGCLTLVAVLGVILLAAAVEGLHLPLRNWPVWQLWPVFILLPVLLFLLLQTLQVLVTPKSARPASSDRADEVKPSDPGVE